MVGHWSLKNVFKGLPHGIFFCATICHGYNAHRVMGTGLAWRKYVPGICMSTDVSVACIIAYVMVISHVCVDNRCAGISMESGIWDRPIPQTKGQCMALVHLQFAVWAYTVLWDTLSCDPIHSTAIQRLNLHNLCKSFNCSKAEKLNSGKIVSNRGNYEYQFN
jgi:hypothetical protein